MMEPLATVFLVLLVACGVAAMAVSDLLAAVVVFGAFSFFSALYFATLGALDVAFTEAVVGAAMSAVFVVTAVFHTTRRTKA
ncbi:MAG: hypothetical protein KatS3mg131_0992 [Candidatus Tectimicrobiota bacterium]|nr:MAG: hypothetical protein KatS3mg131_0992 [Candidatus Tectomicrobia bacterium]